MFFMGSSALPLLFILAAAALSAQENPTFQAGATLVRVDVQVTENRRPVPGLSAADFVLREEGAVRQPEAFGRESEPLQVVLLLDVSGSMGKMLRAMAAVARQALARLTPEDQVAVMLFARRSRVAAELSNDFALAGRALQEAPLERDLGAGTSLNEALLAVAGYLRDLPPFPGRRAVIVLTDNGGVHFQLPDDRVIQSLSAVNAVVNAIVPSGARPPQSPKGPQVNPDFTPADVFRIAADTGGEVLRSEDAGARFREILDRIRLRYSLLLKPAPAPSGAFRRLEVDLTPEARRRYPKAEVRARAGYFIP